MQSQTKSRLNTISGGRTIPTSRRGKSQRSPKHMYNRPTYITLSDFMRIQNEINPINAEYENRKAYEKKIKKIKFSKIKKLGR